MMARRHAAAPIMCQQLYRHGNDRDKQRCMIACQQTGINYGQSYRLDDWGSGEVSLKSHLSPESSTVSSLFINIHETIEKNISREVQKNFKLGAPNIMRVQIFRYKSSDSLILKRKNEHRSSYTYVLNEKNGDLLNKACHKVFHYSY